MTLPVIEPVIAKSGGKPFDDPSWTFDFKYDGFRGLLYIDESRSWICSRHRKVLHQFDPLIRKIREKIEVREVIFDGEIIAVDETERPIFLNLLRRTGAQRYVAFDLLWLNGEDLRSLPLSKRREILARVLPEQEALLPPVLSVAKKGIHFFRELCAYDLEGMIAKRLDDSYRSRTKWLKIKNPHYSQLVGRAKFFHRRKNTST